jgi:PAS domain S-box-containing protein
MARQSQWAQALRNTRNGLFVVDGAQRVLSWNRAAERLFGRAAADVVGRYCFDVIAGRLASGAPWCRPDCGVQRCVKQGRLPPAVEITAFTKDGRAIWLDVACVVLPGKPAPLVAHLLRDITAERSHEKELAEIRAILDADAPYEIHRRRRAPSSQNASPAEGPGGRTASKRLATLTARERTVLFLLADGLSTRAIAERLCISLLTVRCHVANVLRKLGVHRQAAAVAIALREGARRDDAGALLQTD